MDESSPKRVLVVDDDPKVTTVVNAYLKKAGRYLVEVENRPAEAIVRIRETRPDVLLLDWNMPGKGGVEIAQDLQDYPDLRGLPVIFLTGNLSTNEAKRRMEETPGLVILVKPFGRDDIVRVVDETCSRLAPNSVS